MSKHLEFNALIVAPKMKTKVFEVLSKEDGFYLGRIHWRGGWRQYVFTPTKEPSDWSHDCLADLSVFIKNLMEARKKPKDFCEQIQEAKPEQ